MEHPHYIVDGYNFILRRRRIDHQQEHALWDAREELIRQLVVFRGQKNILISVVFDGQDLKGLAQQSHPTGIKVIFSQAPLKADPAILKIIQSTRNPRNITLVTSDQTLARLAAGAGCLVISIEAFAEKMAPSQEEPEYAQKYKAQLTSEEMNNWLKLFQQPRDE